MEQKIEKQIKTTCYHCGNTGMVDVVGVHTNFCVKNATNEHESILDNLDDHFSYMMLVCPVCKRVSLQRRICKNYSVLVDANDITLYPKNISEYIGVPINIRKAYEAALKARSSGVELCLTALRRVIELICKDKKAEGNSLYHKIKHLSDSGILPTALSDAFRVVRILGNEAVHEVKSIVSQYDVEEMIGIIESIIDYLYILPYRISLLNRTIGMRDI